jgi:hypothetical protein
MRTVPKRFEILGHEISVEWSDTLYEDEDAWGLCIFHEHRIILQAPTDDLKITKSHLLSTFWHEYYHMALYCTGYTELALNEELVDSLGGAAHQFHKTKANK